MGGAAAFVAPFGRKPCGAPSCRARLAGGERWEPITLVRIRGDQVLLTVADGTTHRAGYSDAVHCRRPAAGRPAG